MWKLFLVLLVFAVVVVVDARSPGQPKNYNYSPRSKVKDGVCSNKFMIEIQGDSSKLKETLVNGRFFSVFRWVTLYLSEHFMFQPSYNI